MISFLNNNRVGVFAIQMKDGTPHSAALHFAYDPVNLTFVFLTSPLYRKHEPLESQNDVRASFVVGVSEDEMKTVQLDGVARLGCSEKLRELYEAKFPEKAAEYDDNVFFIFTPDWWRYVDWNKPEGKTVLNSDGSIIVS